MKCPECGVELCIKDVTVEATGIVQYDVIFDNDQIQVEESEVIQNSIEFAGIRHTGGKKLGCNKIIGKYSEKTLLQIYKEETA